MKFKAFPEDFVVDEFFDINSKLEDRGGDYGYFILRKKNYTTQKALERVSDVFKVPIKFIGFSGTKDKCGITSQFISLKGIRKHHIEKNLPFFNSLEDLELEYVGNFKSRINLGDNLGNNFTLTLRECLKSEVDLFLENSRSIEEEGVLNYFDDQRFGYAGNSHIVGKFLLKGDFYSAFWEILLSIPKSPNDRIKLWNDFLIKNRVRIENCEAGIINEVKEVIPKFLRNEFAMLEWILDPSKKNDFAGAIRLIPKKIRTLYIHAYQSFIFNSLCDMIKTGIIPNIEEIELPNDGLDSNLIYFKEVINLLDLDGLKLEDFSLRRMPEIKLRKTLRKTRIFPKNFKLIEIKNDVLEGLDNSIIVFSFFLPSGAYATNVIKQLFS